MYLIRKMYKQTTQYIFKCNSKMQPLIPDNNQKKVTMPKDGNDTAFCSAFAFFLLPDVTKVNYTKLTKFANDPTLPSWRTVYEGLNLQGVCGNKKGNCAAQGQLVWVPLGYGKFQMGEMVCKALCPVCKKPTKGDKRIGLYKCSMEGEGIKVKPTKTDEQQQEQFATQPTQATLDDAFIQQNEDRDDSDEEQEIITFQKKIIDSQDSFLKMDQVNGTFIQWRYMKLKIMKLKEKTENINAPIT